MLSYVNQKILIIDNFPEFRLSLKRLVQNLGAKDIDVAVDGKAGISMCRNKSYDIILSDYNLGEGIDGQQVLEELLWRDLLKPTTVFVMVTAENTTQMVMAAIEYTPDSYLTKPFTEDELKTRLDKLLHKKISLEKINRAIVTRNYPKALKLADAMIAAKSKYSLACMRIKADLYLKMSDLASAKEIYERVISRRPVAWALTGLGKLLFAKQDFAEAEAQFKQLLSMLPDFPEALEWLAKIEVANDQPEAAQKHLERALAVSPKVSQRQLLLGDLAHRNGDLEVAKRAYRTAIKSSQYSIHHSPESYLKLVSILTEELSSSGGIKNKRILAEAISQLENLEQAFKTDQEVKLRVSISRHALYHKIGRDEAKHKHLDIAKSLFSELNDTVSGQATTDMAGAYYREGDVETCQALLTQVLEKYGDDSDIMASVELIIDDKEAFHRAVEASKTNSAGIKAHAENKLDEAIMHFRQALEVAPENISYNMNLIQALIKVCEQQPSSLESIVTEMKGCFENIKGIHPNDYRYVRLQQLQRMVNDLQIGLD